MKEITIELDKRNTLFPSEMKLLCNTIQSILSVWARKRYYANRTRLTTDPKIGLYPEEQRFIQLCIEEKDSYLRCKHITEAIINQQNFLEEYIGADWKMAECKFIAKRLDQIIPKMIGRVHELHELYLDSQFIEEIKGDE